MPGEVPLRPLEEALACCDVSLAERTFLRHPGDRVPERSRRGRARAALGRMDEAHQAAARFRSLCAEDANFARYAANHANICKRQEDKDNWLNGYRMVGLLD